MNKRRVAAVALMIGIMCGAVWWQWHLTRHGASPKSLLKRADLAGTSVTYSWTGGFGLGNVRATFSGSGSASLQLGDKQPVRTKITDGRYRGLIRSLATNEFDQIRVHRRWGTYLYDIGRYEIVLADGRRRTVAYVDEKHYVSHPELLSAIVDEIYSFQKELGQRLDYGPFGMAATRDLSELVVLAAVAACVVVGLLLVWFRSKRKKSLGEPGAPPNAGSAGPPPASSS